MLLLPNPLVVQLTALCGPGVAARLSCSFLHVQGCSAFIIAARLGSSLANIQGTLELIHSPISPAGLGPQNSWTQGSLQYLGSVQVLKAQVDYLAQTRKSWNTLTLSNQMITLKHSGVLFSSESRRGLHISKLDLPLVRGSLSLCVGGNRWSANIVWAMWVVANTRVLQTYNMKHKILDTIFHSMYILKLLMFLLLGQ